MAGWAVPVPPWWVFGSQVLPVVANSCPPQVPEVFGHPHRDSSGVRRVPVLCHGVLWGQAEPLPVRGAGVTKQCHLAGVQAGAVPVQGGRGEPEAPGGHRPGSPGHAQRLPPALGPPGGGDRQQTGGQGAGGGRGLTGQECAGWARPVGAVWVHRPVWALGVPWVGLGRQWVCARWVHRAMWALGGWTEPCRHWVGTGCPPLDAYAIPGCWELDGHWVGAGWVLGGCTAPCSYWVSTGWVLHGRWVLCECPG